MPSGRRAELRAKALRAGADAAILSAKGPARGPRPPAGRHEAGTAGLGGVSMFDRRSLLGAAGAGLALGLAPRIGRSADPIKIGEINSYSRIPAFLLSYRKGWELATWEINQAGGVLGREIEVVSRDDGNRYTWRLRPSTYMLSSRLAQAAAKIDAVRWASIAPNYEYGQSAVAWFTKLLKKERPEGEFVAAQWPAFGKLDAGPTVQALLAAEPDAIYNATFAGDLIKFVREGRT